METLAFRYMTRFVCIADRCEDTCCSNWRIAVDRPAYERLERVLSPSELVNVEKNATATGDKDYAFLKVLPSGECGFLRDKLCSVQSQHGEDVLPNSCALYPRHVARVEDRIEIAGAFSCPEVARLALLAPDAMDLITLDESAAAELRKHREPTRTLMATTPYARAIDRVRVMIFDIINYRTQPLAVRFTMLAHFADKLSDFFSRDDASTFDDAKLNAAARMTTQPAVWSALATQATAQSFTGQPAFEFVASLVLTRLQLPHPARYADLVQKVATVYQPADGALEPEAVWARYATRSRALEARFGDRLDQYFRHYAMQFWLREWYTESESLERHALTFFVRLATLRFLLVGHPDLNGAEDLATLDRVAVEVFQIFVRAVEHELELLKILEAAILTEGKLYGRALLLIKMFSA